MLDTICIEPKTTAQFCVIWLHGLGADGNDFVPIIPNLNLPTDHGIRFVFPHAPRRPITINGQMPMRAWYDIYHLNRLDREDEQGIDQSCQQITTLIEKQNMASQRIIIAGFSQGGAMALHMARVAKQPYGGIIALSTYLPFLKNQPIMKNQSLPILQCHGDYDEVIPIQLGKKTYAYLKASNDQTQWQQYPMGHSVCEQEVDDIGRWLVKRLF